MWMNLDDGDQFNNIHGDSFSGSNTSRRLRPLIPKPSPPCFHATNFFPLTHHHYLPCSAMGDETKRELFCAQPVVVSSRWNPTAEQLRALEELYKRGTRTPSADQIQSITAQLRRFGKIEGKNVFYWFQNHKARERQKRRRQMESQTESIPFQWTDSGTTTTTMATPNYEVEKRKSQTPSTLTEECNTVVGRARASKIAAIECEGAEIDQSSRKYSFIERNATWHLMQVSSSLLTTNNNTHLPTQQPLEALSSINPNHADGCEEEEEEGQTLELFPLRSGVGNEKDSIDDRERSDSMNAHYHFFEFLPLKN